MDWDPCLCIERVGKDTTFTPSITFFWYKDYFALDHCDHGCIDK